jgi:hypothetical protein
MSEDRKSAEQRWTERVWVAVSPWVVGFSANARAAWDHLVVGLIVALVAAVRLWFVHQGPPRVTA